MTTYRAERANILSINARFTAKHLDRLLLPRVLIFCPQVNRIVGYAEEFWRQGTDLWAVLMLEEGTPEQARATAIVGVAEDPDRNPLLISVLYTNLSREECVSLTKDAMRAQGWQTETPRSESSDLYARIPWRSKRRGGANEPN